MDCTQNRRCEKTGSGGTGPRAEAGRQSRACWDHADCGSHDRGGEPACREQVGRDRQSRRPARLEAQAPGAPVWRGRPRLSVVQAQRIRRPLLGKRPDPPRLPFYLWTRAAVVPLIAREYVLAVSLTMAGRSFQAWRMSP